MSVQITDPNRSVIPRIATAVWFAVTLVVLAVGFRQAIFLVPTEATMGNVQRIFYYHLPSAILGMVFPYINCAASLAFLYWRRRDPWKALGADALAVASAEMTVIFVSIGLLTGSLWAKPAWGIWWAWDARTTTYLVLWLLFVSYLITPPVFVFERPGAYAGGRDLDLRGHRCADQLHVHPLVADPASRPGLWRRRFA